MGASAVKRTRRRTLLTLAVIAVVAVVLAAAYALFDQPNTPTDCRSATGSSSALASCVNSSLSSVQKSGKLTVALALIPAYGASGTVYIDNMYPATTSVYPLSVTIGYSDTSCSISLAPQPLSPPLPTGGSSIGLYSYQGFQGPPCLGHPATQGQHYSLQLTFEVPGTVIVNYTGSFG